MVLPIALLLLTASVAYDGGINDEVWLSALTLLAPNPEDLHGALALSAARLRRNSTSPDGLGWLLDVAVQHDGRLMLAGRRAVLLGTRILLACAGVAALGASHLWLAFGSTALCACGPAEDSLVHHLKAIDASVLARSDGASGADAGAAQHRRSASSSSGSRSSTTARNLSEKESLAVRIRNSVSRSFLRLVVIVVVSYIDIAVFTTLANVESFWLLRNFLFAVAACAAQATLLVIVSVLIYTRCTRAHAKRLLPVVSWVSASILKFYRYISCESCLNKLTCPPSLVYYHFYCSCR